MSNIVQKNEAVIESYNNDKKQSTISNKLYTAYLNEHLINGNQQIENKSDLHQGFDNTDLFYLLSLAEKLPVYGVGFGGEDRH